MVDILIIYEHKARELESVCLLKAEMEKRGYKVNIMNLYEFNIFTRLKYLLFVQPKVILTSAIKNNSYLYHHVYRLVGDIRKIINLQWEQVFSPENIESQLPRENAIYCTHICWGDNTQSNLFERDIKNAILTGPIHLDFLRKEFRGIYIDREKLFTEFGIKGRNVFLFISSFAWNNLSDDEIRSFTNELNIDVKKICRLTSESKKQILNWFENLLKLREDITVVYRPHPAEYEDNLIKSMEEKYDNFKIIRKYSIKQWIVASDKTYNWMSTSIVETYFAQKNTYILRPIDIGCIEPFIFENADKIGNYDEFLKTVDEKGETKFPISKTNINKYYHLDEDIPSFMKICNLIEDVYNTDEYDLPNNVTKYKLSIHDILKTLLQLLLVNLNIQLNSITFKFTPNRYRKKLDNFLKRQYHAKNDIVPKREIDELTVKLRKYLE